LCHQLYLESRLVSANVPEAPLKAKQKRPDCVWSAIFWSVGARPVFGYLPSEHARPFLRSPSSVGLWNRSERSMYIFLGEIGLQFRLDFVLLAKKHRLDFSKRFQVFFGRLDSPMNGFQILIQAL
jgi:hypothetical protein